MSQPDRQDPHASIGHVPRSESSPSAACGQEFDAFDGPQKCGRVKGHRGAHTRDPIGSERAVIEAAAYKDEYEAEVERRCYAEGHVERLQAEVAELRQELSRRV